MVVETVTEHSASALKLWTAVAIFLATYGIVLSEKINRAIIAVIGGGLMVLLGILTQDQAVAAVDFNTIGLLLGMMIIVAITKDSGVFQYVAIKAAKIVKANPVGLIIVFALVTAVFSALLDNVTTVLLTTPVLLLITRELGVKPYPYLFASIIASNIGGSSTLIGDPTTVMIGSAASLSFNDFIFNVMPISAVLMTLSMIPILLIWKGDLLASDHNKDRIMKLNEKEAIKDPALLKKSAAVLLTVITGFIIGHSYHIMPATIAMTGAAVLLLLDNIKNDHEKQEHRVHHSIGEAEWITIFFFAGLFVVVHGLQGVGAIGFLADQLMAITAGDFDTTVITVLWGAAILSALVDNIPFVATMIPMIQSMNELPGFEDLQPLWWALGLGACLGGSGSLIGSSANLVVAGFAARSGNAIGFLKYMAVAFPLMIVNVSIANAYIYYRYLAE